MEIIVEENVKKKRGKSSDTRGKGINDGRRGN